MADYLSDIVKAMRKAGDAYAETLATLSKAFEQMPKQAAGLIGDRAQILENWLRVARMSKDGLVISIEQGFELWERECRRMAASAKSGAAEAPSPFEAWAENWKRASEALLAGSSTWNSETQKFAKGVQESLQEGLHAWQSLWESSKKS
jgi:ParB-like chromosome segregation protein Spo0J